jgi:hypothetical protein
MIGKLLPYFGTPNLKLWNVGLLCFPKSGQLSERLMPMIEQKKDGLSANPSKDDSPRG